MAESQQAAPQPPPYYYAPPKKSKWWVPVLIIGIIIILFFLIIVAFFGIIGSFFAHEPVEVKSNTVLYLNLGERVEEHSTSGPFSFLRSSKDASFLDILLAIKRAKNDDRVKGIFYRASGTQMGFAKTSELIETLEDFKKSGKFIYAYIETGSENDYMKALPADKIFMPSEGMMEMNGFSVTALFMKGLFDKIGINFHVQQFEDFKSAGESYSRKSFSDSARMELGVLINQRYRDFVNTVSRYRKMETQNIINIMNRGVYSADSLKYYGFIDSLATEAEVKEILKSLAYGKDRKDYDKKKLHLLNIDSYVSAEYDEDEDNVAPEDTRIAIVYGVGSIVSARTENVFGDDQNIVSKDFVRNLKKAREDKTIKAIVLRIDSPGGSVIASDEIWHEIVKTRKVKPVYASMSDVAASGGYYMAMACDTIIAHPSTITGSIGVIMVIPEFSGLLNNLDITVDTLSTGPAAQALNGVHPYSEREKQQLYLLGKGMYDRFVTKAAISRNKTYDEMRALAKGRVWTGEDAKSHGLVDVLGGLQESINLAKKRIGVSAGKKIRIKIFPEPQDEMKSLLKAFGLTEDEEENVKAAPLTKMAKQLSSRPSAIAEIYMALPDPLKRSLSYLGTISDIAEKEHGAYAMPDYLVIQ